MDARAEITNLVLAYAERVDAGDFEGVADLLTHARVTAAGTQLHRHGYDEVLAIYVEGTRRYPDGTPRTKHVTTNLLIEVDDTDTAGTCRSYFTVLQAITGTLTLQPIIAGRYHDTFETVDGVWRFTGRHMIVDLVGDLGHHLLAGYGPGERAAPTHP